MRLPALTNRSPMVGAVLVAGWQRGALRVPRAPVVVSLRDGRRLELDLRHHTQRKMAVDLFEAPEGRAIRALLCPGDVVVDVGAHVGWITTLAATAVGPTGTVWSFEPYPESAARLARNVDLNRLENVRTIRAAVGASSGTVRIGLQDADSGGVTAVRAPVTSGHEVPLLRLDDVVPPHVRVALLKIDVEGGEPAVLAGAADTLARTRAVLIELNREALGHAGSTPEAIADELAGLGFDRLRVLTRSAGWLRPSLGGQKSFGLPDFSNLIATREQTPATNA